MSKNQPKSGLKIWKRSTFDGSTVELTFDDAVNQLVQFRKDMTRLQIIADLEDGYTIGTEISEYTGNPPKWWF